jgi:glycosyltransferase involved in cell wall biosynthesis
MVYSLFYLGKPTFGGWISFTAHLALKHSLKVYKLGARTESRERSYGYGVKYTNVKREEIAKLGTPVITAVDKNYYDVLQYFPDNSFIVIHDPSEVSKKTSSILLEQLKRFRIITIRESVKTYLQEKYGLPSMFILHPFFKYQYTKSENPELALSISRIDFDKHTDIILRANQKLPKCKQISIYGKANTQYVFFKLKDIEYEKHYKGSFEKTFESLNNILKDGKYVVDMSVIKFDGGGTQYTFLEAIYQRCALVINKRWISGFKTPFEDGVNCFVVADGDELANLLKKETNVSEVLNNAELILEPHTNVDWVKKMDEYLSIYLHVESGSVIANGS